MCFRIRAVIRNEMGKQLNVFAHDFPRLLPPKKKNSQIISILLRQGHGRVKVDQKILFGFPLTVCSFIFK